MLQGTHNPLDTGAKGAHVAVSGVSYLKDGKAILDDVTLDLSERRVGIVGRNGSGKTTLARTLCGLITPQTGRVAINGVDVANDRHAAIGTVGIIFQNPDHQIIFPTVEEEVAFGLKQLGKSRAEAIAGARAALAAFGRAAWAEKSVSTLSQGQRHLVCLISVLAMEPAVIVLDEPFTGLDIPTTRQLHAYLDRLQPTLIQITHDPAILQNYDRVIWLEQGRVQDDGPAARVLAGYVAQMESHGGPGCCL